MKKLISIMLVVVMIFSSTAVFADEVTSQEMQNVLAIVKGKVKVDTALDKFSGSTSTYNDKTTYHFRWYNEEDGKSVSVSADSNGRIESYSDYSKELSGKKISKFSRKEIVDFAKNFIDTALPETLTDTEDVLVYNDDSYDARGNLRYSFTFNRIHKGIKVKDNYVSITVCALEDSLFVRSMNVRYDYGWGFSEDGDIIANPQEAYMKAFPLELVYTDYYDYTEKRPEAVPLLSYRPKDNEIGYIDALTGEITTEDFVENELLKEEAAEDSTQSGGGGGSNTAFTPAELEELTKVEGLVSIGDIEKTLKALPYVDLDNKIVEDSSLSKNYKDEYTYWISYSGEDYDYVSVDADAESGQILSLYQNNRAYSEENLSDKELNSVKAKTEEFIKLAAPDEFKETEFKDENVNYNRVSEYYIRKVNGIDYVDNGINITFDAKSNLVLRYNIRFTDGEFTLPEKAIGKDEAYKAVFAKYPIELLYIKRGGKFHKVFKLPTYSVLMNAESGEIIGAEDENINFSYSDTDGHWCENAANALADIQVGFPGGTLQPEQAVTQAELLRLFAGGLLGKYYQTSTEEELYETLVSMKIITKEEKAPTVLVKREDAFVFMIRFANLEEVAKLSDIYKVNYKDGANITNGKIGYAAILSGFGVVCGNGGNLRPQDNLTRAEAVSLLYKFLSK